MIGERGLTENTLIHTVHSIVTDFIWLTYGDIDRMLSILGIQFGSAELATALLKLYRTGKFVRRGQKMAYQYMRVPS